MLGTPKLVAELQQGSSRAERENHLPQPAGQTSLDAYQDTVDNVEEENYCLKEKDWKETNTSRVPSSRTIIFFLAFLLWSQKMVSPYSSESKADSDALVCDWLSCQARMCLYFYCWTRIHQINQIKEGIQRPRNWMQTDGRARICHSPPLLSKPHGKAKGKKRPVTMGNHSQVNLRWGGENASQD